MKNLRLLRNACCGAVFAATLGCDVARRENTAEPAPVAAIGAALAIGDAVPDCRLTSHRGQPLELSSLRPKAVLMTFIFTRCPAMEFCPRMSLKFQETRKALDESALKDSVELVSVSLDPEHDTPAALAAYARSLDAPPAGWTFAAASTETLAELKRLFSVRAEKSPETGAIEHNLVTALIDPAGRVRKLWEGNAWKTAEVLAEISSAVPAAKPVQTTPAAAPPIPPAS